MNTKPDFQTFLNTQDIVIFPGATGTELQRRGYATKLPLWSAGANLEAYDLLTQIHKDYFLAGADVCVTNTFRTTARTYAKVGEEATARNALDAAVKSAKEAQDVVTDRPTYIAGSFAPLEDCYEVDLVPPEDQLESEHAEQVTWLVESGVDFLLPETVNSIVEARYMAKAASESGVPFIISFVVDENANLLDGSSFMDVFAVTDMPGRVGVSLNCRAISVIDNAYRKIAPLINIPVALYANGFGKPHDDLGWLFEDNDNSLDKFVKTADHWHKLGAKIIGGCCGTTPKYIEALSNFYRSH